MKKFTALLLSVLMLLSLMAGCKNSDGTNTPGATTEPTEDPGLVGPSFQQGGGSLYLTAGASILVTYDAQGVIQSVEAQNRQASDWLAYCDDMTGATCNEIISKFVKDTHVLSQGTMSYVLIKQNKGSGYPTQNFMTDLKTLAEDALSDISSSAKLLVLTVDKLDSNGHMDLATAKELVLGYLGVQSVENFSGTTTPVNGFYSFQVRYNGIEEDLHVNAVSGGVGEGLLYEGPGSAEDDSAEATDPKEPLVTAPTQP